MEIGGIAALGWDEAFEAAFGEHRALGRVPARVVAVHRETSIVRDGRGEDRPAVVSGRFRFDAMAPADFPTVGDWVALESDPDAGPDGSAMIAAILPRRGLIRRNAADPSRRGGGRLNDEQVLAANVDVAFLVAGLDGDLNLRRLERYLAVAWSGSVEPVVVLNKADVVADLEERRSAVEAIANGVPVLALSALTRTGLDELSPYLRAARTAVVLGSSGVGKSTLVNALLGEERQATRAVREDDSRGRHTTTHRELFELPGGGLLIDTPGIRALEVIGAEEGLAPAFDDVADIAAACRFSDCGHEVEPGCAVLAAVAVGTLAADRLESWRKLGREAAHVQRREDPLARIEERRRWKTIHKSVRRQMQQREGEQP